MITNGSYGRYASLKEWFLYRRSDENSFVGNHLNESNYAIIATLEWNKNVQFVKDENDKVFLNGDGNHRLLTIMLKHYLEYNS